MDIQLLKELVSTPGVSGREERIRSVVEKALSPLFRSTRVDRLGNLVGVRSGAAPKVMVAAHMDTIGFLVRHIDDSGFLRLSPVGGFDARTLFTQRVLVCGREDCIGLLNAAEKPLHLQTKDEPKGAPKIDDLFVDLMMPVDEVKAKVRIGDPVSLVREPVQTAGAFTAPYLDDRLGVFVMLEALRQAENTSAEIHAVISVQEEVGVRGAVTSAYEIEPHVGIAVDVTIAGDLPGSDKSQQVSRAGDGVALGLMDGGSISDPRLVEWFRDIAAQQGIPLQEEILPRGGTDAQGIQLSRSGVPVITVSIPVRYIHTTNEMAYLTDIDASARLLARFLESAHELDLSW
ncbi:MAG TPA: M42 family metallopeptidase [Actinomycetota bacterium]|nr:M42 family metallopeptidase [Actinomycetota bacterium]